QATAAPAAAPAARWETALGASLRTRAEGWRWFEPPPGVAADGEYGFVGTLLRVALTARRGGLAFTVEGAAPLLVALSADALAPPPQGQLGFGGAYRAANGGDATVARAFVKQAHVRLGAAPGARGASARLGRFELSDGAELAPRDPTLASLKRDRIAQRLVGPFGWTHVGRSFDGVHLARTRAASGARGGGGDLTLAAALPTEGAFRAAADLALEFGLAYAAYTRNGGDAARGRGAGDARLFALHYADWRDVAPVDNRPAAA
ncbi:hypothetical protein PYV61_26145, partial [Roseisolibacter sp. H3M3-2]